MPKIGYWRRIQEIQDELGTWIGDGIMIRLLNDYIEGWLLNDNVGIVYGRR